MENTNKNLKDFLKERDLFPKEKNLLSKEEFLNDEFIPIKLNKFPNEENNEIEKGTFYLINL